MRVKSLPTWFYAGENNVTQLIEVLDQLDRELGRGKQIEFFSLHVNWPILHHMTVEWPVKVSHFKSHDLKWVNLHLS